MNDKFKDIIMTPRLSKFVFTSHITFSIGWFGAVTVFLVLAIIGVTSRDMQLARATYLAMELSGWFVIVPFCFGSLLTGIVQAVCTQWGLFKHYWIVIKLILTLAATILLLLHMQPISYLAGLAAKSPLLNTQNIGLRIQLIADAGAALIVLMAIITISVFKPWGRIQFAANGTGEAFKGIKGRRGTTIITWRLFLLIGLVSLFLVFILMHLFGGGMGNH